MHLCAVSLLPVFSPLFFLSLSLPSALCNALLAMALPSAQGHAYRGVFGCHTALVLRRLRRLCERLYGSLPRFAVSSATIANPLQHAALLLGVPQADLLLIDGDGSPHGQHEFALWNPPLTATAQQVRLAQGQCGWVNAEVSW